MPNQSKKTLKQILAEIGHDFEQFNKAYISELKAVTPVAKGTARRGWRSVYRNQLGKQTNYPVIKNDVPYIDVLEQGHSKQAPRGIINPANKRTRRRR
jgi:hypothetical protein